MDETQNQKKIHLLDNYYMTADANQYTLIKKIIRTSRKDNSTYEAEDTIGYYPTVQSLCKKLIQDSIRSGVQDGDIQSLREMASHFETMTQRLESAIQF